MTYSHFPFNITLKSNINLTWHLSLYCKVPFQSSIKVKTINNRVLKMIKYKRSWHTTSNKTWTHIWNQIFKGTEVFLYLLRSLFVWLLSSARAPESSEIKEFMRLLHRMWKWSELSWESLEKSHSLLENKPTRPDESLAAASRTIREREQREGGVNTQRNTRGGHRVGYNISPFTHKSVFCVNTNTTQIDRRVISERKVSHISPRKLTVWTKSWNNAVKAV